MKQTYRFVLIIFFVILISVPGFWLLRGKPSPQVSVVEGRVLGLPEGSYPTLKIAINYIKRGEPQKAIALVWDLFTGGSLQRKFDGAATDQFPLRMSLIKFSKAVDRQIIKVSYSLTGDQTIPADMTSGIYIMLKYDAFTVEPGTFNDEGKAKIDERIENYKELVASYPEINFYIYYLETLPFSQYHPLNAYFNDADEGQSFSYFKSKLTDQIRLGSMPLNSFENHLENYFRTDHHWNTNGILRAYQGTYDLISQNYTDISPKIIPTSMVDFPDIAFLGSHARRTLYPVQGEPFSGFKADFPPCITTDQGVAGDYDYRDEYLNGEYATTAFTDHYGLYYGTQTGLLRYGCQTETDRNILIIGDSYARPLVSLVAAHYNNTYFIDLRQTPDFTLSGFVSEHNVDDILVVSDYEVVFLDTEQWMIKP
jgi:hypothetical protein